MIFNVEYEINLVSENIRIHPFYIIFVEQLGPRVKCTEFTTRYDSYMFFIAKIKLSFTKNNQLFPFYTHLIRRHDHKGQPCMKY
jgi:hypothetical protein